MGLFLESGLINIKILYDKRVCSNQKRLEYLEKTVKLIDIASRVDKELNGNEAIEIIRVKRNDKYVIKYCSDNRIMAREYEVIQK